MNIGKLADIKKILALLLLFFVASFGTSAVASDDSKHRLLGTDQNRDGVRDDVEIEIDANFTGEINKQTRKMAVKFQLILSGALGHQEINDLIEDIAYLNSCIINAAQEPNVGTSFLLPVQMNTVARIRTYLKASADAYDEVGPPDYKNCESNSDSTVQ